MKIEIRNNSIILDGYVNAVCRDSRILPSPHGKFVEQIKATVWERALEKAEDVKLLFNHRNDRELGSIKQGNLELFEDNIGLRAICTIEDEEVIEKAKNGKLRGWSFGFIAQKDTWEDFKEGISRRFIEELDLLEVSILDKTPAYIGTSIEQRGEETVVTELRNDEFTATVIDNTVEEPIVEEVKEEVVETTVELVNEERVEPVKVDYSLLETELYLMKERGK